MHYVRRTVQWFFLRLERLFNLVFGDRLNPLYHLGAIAYLMTWIAVVSGVYLYIFLDTGVKEAYESVERITHNHFFYIGQIMRGLHRYASDGMVLAMALHMLRHFAFDHYRGFRWFSWVTGVFVLWLVYASGINGFMLPWDRLAQFITIATAEWLDWLPIFSEPMARNFLHEGSVNDRLFSLLAFMHIGISLMLLLVLWVHTQRVAKAETNPPRRLALPLLLALIVLSLVWPVLSQGPANLDTVITGLKFDWFYLAIFPLIYVWSPEKVWWLVLGGTGLLVLLPWLPPVRRVAKGFRLTLRPGDDTVVAHPGESILEAGLRAGVALPFECRSGGCGECKCTILQGSVDHGAYQESALTEAERRAGKALMCCATPLSDLDLECENIGVARDIPIRTFMARVEKLEQLTEDVMRVMLKPLDPEPIRFHAGQYINIVLEDRERRAFSFATAPHESELIELHVKLVPGGAFTTYVFNAMKPGDTLRCEGPLGKFYLREDSDRPIIFVAGSTGFAPVKSMVEYAFHAGLRRPMHLYWGVRSLADMYMKELPERWAREHANFKFIPVLSEPAPGDNWTGRTGSVHEAILHDFPVMSDCEVYACGSVGMVESAHAAFLQKGMTEDRCFSDAFNFAPHIKGQGGEVVHL